MTAIEIVRADLRIPDGCTDYDGEIRALIRDCGLDLESAGVRAPASLHPRFEQAVKAYAKAFFGPGDDDSERWEKVYAMIRDSMALDRGG